MFTPKIIVFDLECTGFSHKYERVIDIGAINLSTGEAFQTLVKPEARKIPEEVVELTHITNEMVENAPSQKEAFLAFRDFIGDCDLLLGHNVTFDLRHLTASFRRLHIPYKPFRYIDTQRIMGKLHPERGKKLCDVCDYYNIINESAHRAYDDACATAKVYEAMVMEAFRLSTPPLADPDMYNIFEPKQFEPANEKQLSLLLTPNSKPATEPKIIGDPATEKQINYIKILIAKTGDTVDFDTLSKHSAIDMIEELKKKVYGPAKVISDSLCRADNELDKE